MLRGIASFGPRKHLRSDTWLSLSEDPPVTVAAVDTRAKIVGLVDDVVAMTSRGLITLERARLVSGNIDVFEAPHDAVKLTICVGRQEHVDGAPAFYAVCDLLYREGSRERRFSSASTAPCAASAAGHASSAATSTCR
jgi:PII-like signaling protein